MSDVCPHEIGLVHGDFARCRLCGEPMTPAESPAHIIEDGSAPMTELTLLREFYDTWLAFHAIANDRIHRRVKQAAAQEIVDANHAIQRFRQPIAPQQERPRIVVANG